MRHRKWKRITCHKVGITSCAFSKIHINIVLKSIFRLPKQRTHLKFTVFLTSPFPFFFFNQLSFKVVCKMHKLQFPAFFTYLSQPSLWDIQLWPNTRREPYCHWSDGLSAVTWDILIWRPTGYQHDADSVSAGLLCAVYYNRDVISTVTSANHNISRTRGC